jgi:hypothetical protein
MKMVSASIVAVDEGRDFMEVVPGVFLALVPFLIEIFAPKISRGNYLNYSLDTEV